MLAEVEERLPKSDQHHRIFRYNRALAMFKLGAYDLTLQETERLGEEYYDLLGLSPEQVIGRNPPAIRPLLPKGRRRLITRLRRSGPPPQRKVVIPPAMQKLLAARNGPAAPPQQRRTKVGRNERCPCQSGRKYKHCHGR
ncbi:SEC-C domain-containing protein [Bradyrhizobium sp. BRP20]|uniref:SEC-C metal-binding domain-containing protein n=1 Tax=unclassified Bradyrhizobium TaxID=2631580 RepID=UPI0029F7F3F7|nr:SEC-C domain-containing protein [Bradyrhizobium sp. BRP20]MCA1472290.1 SEC-C domain-containing protein [Bradyrhizobium sp. IC3195]MCA1499237.1 SEC-C domain-containing protein [Bradyrhizobium sp. NBAIM14]MCA1550683.1 SEC-C domain-containing protein [Bradyrhizobium sp. BRP19]